MSDTGLTSVPGLIAEVSTTDQRCRLRIGHNAGRTFETFAAPGLSTARQHIPFGGFIPCAGDSFAFGTPTDGIAVTPDLIHQFWRTDNGGRTWTKISGIAPTDVVSGDEALADQQVDLAITGG